MREVVGWLGQSAVHINARLLRGQEGRGVRTHPITHIAVVVSQPFIGTLCFCNVTVIVVLLVI